MSETAGYPLPSLFQTAVGIVAFFFPLMLYATWATLAFADLGRREDRSPSGTVGWVMVILLLPWIGAAAYHLVGRSTISAPIRGTMLAGGVGVYGLLLLLGSALGGIS